jgi:hypothetical protein
VDTPGLGVDILRLSGGRIVEAWTMNNPVDPAP